MDKKEKAGKNLPLVFVRSDGSAKGHLILTVARLVSPSSS